MESSNSNLTLPFKHARLTGHHWSNSITMATPIAHKGGTAAAKVVAATVIDFLTKPALLIKAKDYFENVQKRMVIYTTNSR